MNFTSIHNRNLFVIDNLISKEECDIFVKTIEQRIETGQRRTFTTHSTALTDKYNNPDLTAEIYAKIIKIVYPEDFICPSNFILTSKYENGAQIGIHTDTPYTKGLNYSKYKVLIYLNDDFEKGHTEFYTDMYDKVLSIKPKTGKCVIFNMDIYHSGTEAIGTKYILGFEIIGKD